MYDTIIIGGGPAGLGSALYARRGGLKVLVIEKMAYGGQMNLTGEIENYLGFASIAGYELAENMRKPCADIGVEFKSGEVTDVKLDGEIKSVTLNGENIEAKTIVLAMGARARNLGIDTEKNLVGSGVSYCAHCDGNFFRNKDVVVIGGGNTALTDALYLSNLCNKVYLVHRRDEFRGNKILVDRLKEKENVTLLLNSVVKTINGKFAVESVEVEDKEGTKQTVKVQGVFVAVGTIPNSELVSDMLDCNQGKFIKTDENMKTSIDGVYAVGDIIEKPLRQVITAVADGAVSANHILTLLA